MRETIQDNKAPTAAYRQDDYHSNQIDIAEYEVRHTNRTECNSAVHVRAYGKTFIPSIILRHARCRSNWHARQDNRGRGCLWIRREGFISWL